MLNSELLSKTPLFLNYHWISQPLADNSWRTLPDDILGDEFAHFIRALKELDTAGYPRTPVNDLDYVDLCKALGVDIPAHVGALPGHIGSGYTIGRGRAWLSRLHFQVLDLLLFEHAPRMSPPPIQPAFVSSWGKSVRQASPFSAPFPSPSRDRRTLQMLSKAYGWDKSMKDFNRQLSETKLKAEAVAGTSKTPESMPAAKRVAKRQNQLSKGTVHSNIESAAAGLVWILEYGSEFAPVFKGGVLNMCSTEAAKDRYRDSSKPADLLDLRVGTVERFLRPLSRVLGISSILVFGENLRDGFIDMDTETEIHNRLCSTRSELAALPFVETCIYTVMRGLCSHDVSVENLSHSNLTLLTKKLPEQTSNDTLIFKRLVDWNLEQRKRIETYASVAPDQPSLPPAAIPSTSVLATPGIYRFDIPEADSNISAPDLRPIARGLSKPPPFHSKSSTVRSFSPDRDPYDMSWMYGRNEAPMKLFKELSADEQQKLLSDSQTYGPHPAITETRMHCPDRQVENGVPSSEMASNVETVNLSVKTAPKDTPHEASPPLSTTDADIQVNDTTQALPQDSGLPVNPSNDPPEDTSLDATATAVGDQLAIQRRSTRLKVSTEQPKAAKSISTGYIPPKRKASTQLARTAKKTKPIEADAESNNTQLSLSDIKVERSVEPAVVLAREPDGSGELSFDFLSHKDAEPTEYRIISDVKQVMKLPTDEHLHCLTLDQWESMSVAKRWQISGSDPPITSRV